MITTGQTIPVAIDITTGQTIPVAIDITTGQIIPVAIDITTGQTIPVAIGSVNSQWVVEACTAFLQVGTNRLEVSLLFLSEHCLNINNTF